MFRRLQQWLNQIGRLSLVLKLQANYMGLIKKHKYIITISFLFVTLYSLISLVNHYLFKTYALDLGLYTNAAFKYAHFILADSSMIKGCHEPILGGHFDLYLVIFSPLTYLFGTYTLLIVQIIALITGGIGIFRYFQIIGNKKSIPYYALIYFYIFFGIYGALSFDYHSVVVASCVVPWLFISIYRNKMVVSVLLLVFMLVSQENFALFVFFITLGLIIEYRKNQKKSFHLILLSLISLAYFLIVILCIIPYFSSQSEYGGFLYSSFGNNIYDASKAILMNPVESFKAFFTNHNNSIYGDFVKAETHIILLVSGLLFLFKKPQYLLMLVPIYFQKFFHDNYLMWGIDGQYNIEFAPIMAIGIFKVISEFKIEKLKVVISFIVLILALISTIRTMDNTILFTEKSKIRLYQKNHYCRDYDVRSVHNNLLKIPKSAKVSAQSPFVPHLSLREDIYQFPIIKNAEYIVYSRKESFYPLSKEEFISKINKLEKSKNWKIIHNNDIKILKKIKL